MPRLRRVPVGRNRERRAGERLHVQVQNLVLQLDVVERTTSQRETEPLRARADLVLPRVLRGEVDEAPELPKLDSSSKSGGSTVRLAFANTCPPLGSE